MVLGTVPYDGVVVAAGISDEALAAVVDAAAVVASAEAEVDDADAAAFEVVELLFDEEQPARQNARQPASAIEAARCIVLNLEVFIGEYSLSVLNA